MFSTKHSKETLKEIQALFINGSSLQEVVSKTNITYPNARYVRAKLVKAGLLAPLYNLTKKKRTQKTRVSTRKISSAPTLTPSTASSGESLRFTVNGIRVNIKDVKSVTISPEAIDIKY